MLDYVWFDTGNRNDLRGDKIHPLTFRCDKGFPQRGLDCMTKKDGNVTANPTIRNGWNSAPGVLKLKDMVGKLDLIGFL